MFQNDCYKICCQLLGESSPVPVVLSDHPANYPQHSTGGVNTEYLLNPAMSFRYSSGSEETKKNKTKVTSVKLVVFEREMLFDILT